MYDMIIKNGMVYDGTGGSSFVADLAVQDGKIAKVGDLTETEAKITIDATGRCVAPGFFDMHSHADLSIVQYPDAESLLGQGITSAFTGHCGMGMAPIGKYWKTQGDDIFALEDFAPLSSAGNIPGRTPVCLSEQMRHAYKKYFDVDMDWTTFGEYRQKLEKQGVGINLAMEVGLQQIRQSALGLDSDRPAIEREICQMEEMVVEAMESGAFGLSIGYDYTPDLSASQEELDRLAQCVKKYDGIVTAHTRNGKDEDPEWQPINGIREFLDMGLRTGAKMHCSHVQPGFRITPASSRMTEQSALATLAEYEEYRNKGVRLTWDVLHPKAAAFYYYPELCSSMLHYILACGGKTAFHERIMDDIYFQWLLDAVKTRRYIVFPRLEADVPVIRCKNSSYIGKTLKDIAAEMGVEFEEAALRILREDMDTLIRPILAAERMFAMDGNVDRFSFFWTRDDATIGTDNCAFNYDYEGMRQDLPSYRATTAAYCGFVHFLLESQKLNIPLEKTIRKLTGNAADILGINNRGRIKEGQQADIVIMDINQLATNENFEDPRQQPSGFDYVIVNGKIAVDHGVHTHVRSGQVIDYRKR